MEENKNSPRDRREERDRKIKHQNRFIFELLMCILVSLVTTIFVLKTGGVI